jgi:hypothetical protein
VLKTAGAFGDEEVVNKAAVRATEASDKALKTQEMRVDKALAQQKREEAEAATDKAVADKVLADAMKNQDEEQRTRLLKAATAQYEKAAEESAKAKASAKESAKHIIAPATPATRVSEGQGVAGEGKAVRRIRWRSPCQKRWPRVQSLSPSLTCVTARLPRKWPLTPKR